MTITTAAPTPGVTGPGDPAEYDIAAHLAATAADLADAVDDNRPDWITLAARAAILLDALAFTKLGPDIGWGAEFWAEADARAAKPRPAAPEDETAELFDAEPYRRYPR